MSYIFSVRFTNRAKQQDFINVEMNSLNQKNLYKYIPTGATDIEIFRWDSKTADMIIDYKEATPCP